MSPIRTTFGPSALLTPANVLTLARVLSTPVIVAMVAAAGAGWAPFGLAFAVGSTDGVDGWLARRQGATRSGAFLDPLADKVVVVAVLCTLAGRGIVGWLPVAVIAAREVSMAAYRMVVGRHGVSIPARTSAKVKTLVQGVAILVALAPPVSTHHTVVSVVLWMAVALTVLTGAQYLRDGRRAAASSRVRRLTPGPARSPQEPGTPTVGGAAG